jgi:hypothetical protein
MVIRAAPPTGPLDAVDATSHICTQNTSVQQWGHLLGSHV